VLRSRPRGPNKGKPEQSRYDEQDDADEGYVPKHGASDNGCAGIVTRAVIVRALRTRGRLSARARSPVAAFLPLALMDQIVMAADGATLGYAGYQRASGK
jgi:hypothetical protein